MGGPKEKAMRSLVRSIYIAGAIIMLAGVQNASAQIIDRVEFTTAFPFTVGHATVPAGSYTITPDFDNPQFLELTGDHVGVFFQAENAEARELPSKTEVVFKRYGDKYLLKEIWVAGINGGATTMAAEPEKHMAKQLTPAADQRVAAQKTAAPRN
jgi:hypothetical protein